MISIYIDRWFVIDDKKKFLFDHIFTILGTRYHITTDASNADIIYSSDSELKHDDAVFLFLNESAWTSGVIKQNVLNLENHDCLHNCYFILNRIWEKGVRKDEFGVVRMKGDKISELITFSYVGEFVSILKERLLSVVSVKLEPLWPDDAKYSLVFSHDVDHPNQFLTPRYYREELAWKRHKNYSFFSRSKSLVNYSLAWVTRLKENKNFGFNFWKNLESSLGGKSAFYVAVTTPFDKHGHRCDVPYHFNDIRMVRAMSEMINKGWEIGLHGSINSHESLERLQEEKHLLEKVLGGYEIKGIRHHYWCLGNDIASTHQRHLKSGFSYDSSLGLNDFLGFRSGTVWPYKLISDFGGESLYEVPPTIMDGNVFYDFKSNEEYFNKIKGHFDYVKSLNGCVVLDWHLEQSNLDRLNGAGMVLLEVLGGMTFSDCFITSPEGLMEWWKGREKRINESH